MVTSKIPILVLLEPALNASDYASKYIPLIEKHIDFNVFEAHIIGSQSGFRLLKKNFEHVHFVSFHPTATCGIGLYLGYCLYLMTAFLKIVRLVPQIGARVLVSLAGHAYTGFVIVTASKLLRRKSLVRISEPTRILVRTRYGLGFLASHIVSLIEQLTFSFSDTIISNRDMHWYSSKIGEKQRLLSQGIDLARFSVGGRTAFKMEGNPNLITVARLDKQKNIQNVICAVSMLRKKYPRMTYYVVGSGPYENSLRDRVKELNIAQQVVFLGYTKPEEIPNLLNSCDMFLLPSSIEGLPSAVLEAMSCGLPVIVGSIGYDGKDWFTDGEDVLLVNGSPRSIAEAVDELITDERLRMKLITNGAKNVREFHDSSKTRTKFSMIVQQLLQNS